MTQWVGNPDTCLHSIGWSARRKGSGWPCSHAPQMTHKIRDGAVGRWTVSQHPATFVVCNPGVLLQKSRQTFSVNGQIESILGFTSVLCCCRVKQTCRTYMQRACSSTHVQPIGEWSGLASSVPLCTEQTPGCGLPMPACEHHPFTHGIAFVYSSVWQGPVPFRLTSEWY